MTKNPNRARNLKLKLGFPQGQANPTTLANLRAYQINYRKTHKEKHKITDKKYNLKRGTTVLSRYLFSVIRQKRKITLKKKTTMEGLNELHKLQSITWYSS